MDRARGKPIAILGAGFAGLVAARALARRSVPYVLLEASPSVGGLARSIAGPDGLANDIGSHFITNRLARQLDAEPLCRKLHRYGESVYLDGRWFDYPFGLFRIPGALKDALRAALRRPVRSARHEDETSAAEVAVSRYGETVANRVVLPLLEAWSGTPAAGLSAAAIARLPESFASTTVLHALRALTGIPIAIGYCRERAVHPLVWHVYPVAGGIGTLCAHLARGLEARTRLSAPVLDVGTDGASVVSITTPDGTMEVAGAISTLPVTRLAGVVRGTDVMEPLRALRYRRLVIVNVLLRGRGILPRVVGWFPEPSVPFFRVTEVPLGAPWTVEERSTVLTVDFGADEGGELWGLDDAATTDHVVRALAPLVPDVASRLVAASVTRTDLGYPVFLKSYEHVRARLERTLDVRGLCSVGRNGEFDHILMEDVYWRTNARVERFCAALDGAS